MIQTIRALLITLVALPLLAQEEAETAEAFCNSLRHPPIREAWAILDGTAHYRPDGAGTISTPLSLRVHMSPAQMRAQLRFGQSERFLVQQVFADGLQGSSIFAEKTATGKQLSLADVGLRPNDLTLSFLYWQLAEELAPEKIGGTACRVLKLETEQEIVHVWASIEHRFPLQVHWFDAGSQTPKRTLRFTDFQALDEKQFWVVKEATIRGHKWKTKVNFTKNQGKAISANEPLPADLFDPEK